MGRKRRPEILEGITPKIKVGCGNLYVTLNEDKKGKGLREVLVSLGKSGGCADAQGEAIERLINLALSYDVPVEEIVKELGDITCHNPSTDAKSCADGLSKIIKKFIIEPQKESQEKQEKE